MLQEIIYIDMNFVVLTWCWRNH